MVFAPCFIYSLKFVISHVCQTVKVTELTTVPFGETNHTCCATYFFCSTSWKKIYFTDFFNYKVSVWKLPINVKGERKHPLKLPLHGSRCGKKNIYIYISMYIEDGTVEQLQPEPRCIVQHSGFKETSKGWLSLSLSLFFFFFGYKTSLCTQRFPGFRFLCFTSCCFPSILSMSTRLRVVQSHDMCLLVSYLRLLVCLR